MAERGDWIHGSAVDKSTRALRFMSVSQVEQADAKAGGCLRKWHFAKILGKKEPPSKKQERGVEGHGQVASYLLTGNRALGPMAARGLHMVPTPGKDLLVEWDILLRPGIVYPNPLTRAHSNSLLAGAPLRLAGVPFLGQLDLSHARGENKGTDNVDESKDPEGTVEVCDWKFVTDDKYLKTPQTLKITTQMVAYAEWVWLVRPETLRVRMSHGYFMEKGRPRKVTTLVSREEIQPQLEHATGVVRSIASAALCTSVEDVDANTSACDKYGGCMHKPYCSAPMRKSLASLIGQTAAEEWVIPAPQIQDKGLIPVASLLSKTSPGVSVAPSTTPATPDPAAVAAEQVRLAFEEKQARIRSLIPAGFEAACTKVRTFQRGFPTLLGPAAVAYAAMSGNDIAVEDAKANGTGTISYVEITDPADMTALVGELEAAGAVASPLPPDAPMSDPRLASEGTTTLPTQMPVDVTTQTTVTLPFPTTPFPTTVLATSEVPKKRGRKPKAPGDTQVVEPEPSNIQTVDLKTDSLHIYVNCATTHEVTNLNEWAQNVADFIAKQNGAIDIRCGGEDTSIGFTKWKGILMAIVRDPKAAPLAGGSYLLETRYSEVMEVIAEALILRAKDSGGSYTRGVR